MLCHVGSIWWSCLRYMWILCPLAPSHGICGMSTIADLCIPCHIFIVLWIIMAVVLWTRVVYISYGTVSWCPLHFCHTCSFSSIQPLLVLLDRLSGFVIFTCGFIIIWHRPMVYVASPSSLSILHHHPCSADSHLSGFTFATMSCWVDLVVLPQIHVDSLSFSTVSWYLWHVHLCWPMHSMSHSHSIMDHYGSRAVDTCGLYILWHCLMVSTAFLSYLLLQSNHS